MSSKQELIDFYNTDPDKATHNWKEIIAWGDELAITYQKATVLLADIEQFRVDTPDFAHALRTAINSGNVVAQALRDDLISTTAVERNADAWAAKVDELPEAADEWKDDLKALRNGKKSRLENAGLQAKQNEKQDAAVAVRKAL